MDTKMSDSSNCVARLSGIVSKDQVPTAPDRLSLLGLPIELRLKIFETLFRFTDTIHIELIYVPRFAKPGRPPFSRPIGGIALLSVCHAIHDEAARILYAKNVFQIRIRYPTHLQPAASWLDGIGNCRDLISELRLVLQPPTYPLVPLLERVAIHPLFRHHTVWPRISFCSSASSTSPAALSATHRPIDLEHINSAFQSLASHLPAELRLYAQCPRTLKSVEISMDGASVIAKLATEQQFKWLQASEVSEGVLPCVEYRRDGDGAFRKVGLDRREVMIKDILHHDRVRENVLQRVELSTGHFEMLARV